MRRDVDLQDKGILHVMTSPETPCMVAILNEMAIKTKES
jgi:hypothetical protein